jgi:hypothetical protein
VLYTGKLPIAINKNNRTLPLDTTDAIAQSDGIGFLF